MADDLVFGVRLREGRDFRWPLSLARGNTIYNVRVVFDWMTDEAGYRWPGGAVGQVYLACPPKLSTGGKRQERTVEVISVELVAGGRVKQ
jgi:hypothetical protein